MLEERKAALWEALNLGPEWVLRQELINLKEQEKKQAPVKAPVSEPSSETKVTRTISAVDTPNPRPAGTPASEFNASSSPRKTSGIPSPRGTTRTGRIKTIKGRGVNPEAFNQARVEKISASPWEELIPQIKQCRMCEISNQRICAVPGEGTPPQDLVLIGEAPGAEEDRQGIPFCGPSGKLLDSILKAIGLERGVNLAILNTIKCRPPMNADPTAQEMAACSAFLERQLTLMDPKVIVAMGKPAAKSLFGSDATLTSRRQIVHDMVIAGKNRKVIVTYHPAALLRNPADKRKAWIDWNLVIDTLEKVKNG